MHCAQPKLLYRFSCQQDTKRKASAVFTVGQRVEQRIMANGEWLAFPGIVDAIEGDEFHVTFDDGQQAYYQNGDRASRNMVAV